MDPNLRLSKNLSSVQIEIMRRVRVIAFIYRAIGSPVVGSVAVLVLIFVAGMMVSLEHIKDNILAQTDWSSRVSYGVSSFEHTQIVVQAIAVGIVVLGGFIMFNSVRTVRRSGFVSLFMLRRVG